jgi:hypothetical protein
MRYASLLNELKTFECFDWSPHGNNKTDVNNIPIRRLPLVVEQWVNSYFGEAYHPMMPAYAMDTVRLIEHHVQGSHQSDWELEGMLEAGVDAWRRGIFEASFRRSFTTHFGGLRVLCQVPETEHAIDQPEWIETLNPRDQFQVRITRCHLSEGWGGSGFYTICKDTDLDCDLMSDFCFDSELFVREIAKAASTVFAPGGFTISPESEATHKFSASVPARWITHALIWRNGEEVVLPVPRWNLDDVDLLSTKVQ